MSFDEQPDPLSDCMEAFDKMKARAEAAEAKVASVEKEKHEAECFLASLMDTVNQEIRENGPADVGQYYRRHDANNGVRYLSDLLKRKAWDAEAKNAALTAKVAEMEAVVESVGEAREWLWAWHREHHVAKAVIDSYDALSRLTAPHGNGLVYQEDTKTAPEKKSCEYCRGTGKMSVPGCGGVDAPGDCCTDEVPCSYCCPPSPGKGE